MPCGRARVTARSSSQLALTRAAVLQEKLFRAAEERFQRRFPQETRAAAEPPQPMSCTRQRCLGPGIPKRPETGGGLERPGRDRSSSPSAQKSKFRSLRAAQPPKFRGFTPRGPAGPHTHRSRASDSSPRHHGRNGRIDAQLKQIQIRTNSINNTRPRDTDA